MSQTVAPQRTVVMILVAVYMGIIGVITFCGSLALVGLGSLASSLGSVASTPQGTAAVQAGGGIAVVIGVILLLVAIAFLAIAIGLFLVRHWAYMGAIVVNVIYIVVSIVEVLSARSAGVSATTIIFPALSVVAVILLLVDNDTKRAFGRA
ncbi:MAG: hypothetical protein ACYDBJ_07795 [Aggregatilineales bacterium]